MARGGRRREHDPAGDPTVDGSLYTPNCTSCLSAMEPEGPLNGGVHWLCPNCGQARLA